MSRGLPLVAGVVLAWLWSLAGAFAATSLVGEVDTAAPVVVASGTTTLVAGALAALVATVLGVRSPSVPDARDAAIGAAFGAAAYLVVTSLLTLANGALVLGFVQLLAGLVGPAAGGALGVRVALR